MSDKGKKFSCTRPNQLPQPSGSNNLNKFSNKYHFLSVFLFHWFEFQSCMHTIQGAQISKSWRLGENICWLPLMCSSQTDVTFSLRLIMQTGDRLTGGHKPTLRNPKTKYRVFHNDGPKVFACYSKKMQTSDILSLLGAHQMWSIW